MKRICPMRLVWLACLPFALLAGCHKLIDQLPDTSTLCSIQSITTPTETLQFFYDHYGDPVGITRPGTGTEIYDYEFRYDHAHRLTDIIGTYTFPAINGYGYGTWDKLYYTNGRITLDSVFDFGIINGDRPMPLPIMDTIPLRRVSRYEYDAKGRMKKAEDNFSNTYFETRTFTYDGNGNLSRTILVIFGNTSVILTSGYDHKVNINRTNPIWQFLARDYSMNNRFAADGYNEIGLPTGVSHVDNPYNYAPPELFGFLNIQVPLTFQYNCQLPGAGGRHGY